ncbi:MAG: hypothetical protein H0T54_02465 [Geodermatophilaceae bacterium]|nr:hypothetical protein [Geodermatophilaceae bacterium]
MFSLHFFAAAEGCLWDAAVRTDAWAQRRGELKGVDHIVTPVTVAAQLLYLWLALHRFYGDGRRTAVGSRCCS